MRNCDKSNQTAIKNWEQAYHKGKRQTFYASTNIRLFVSGTNIYTVKFILLTNREICTDWLRWQDTSPQSLKAIIWEHNASWILPLSFIFFFVSFCVIIGWWVGSEAILGELFRPAPIARNMFLSILSKGMKSQLNSRTN